MRTIAFLLGALIMVTMVRLGGVEYHLSAINYHAAEAGAGVWLGQGAQSLGLSGHVDPNVLRQMYRGFGPDGAKLVQNAGCSKRHPGVEICVNLPKELSVLWAISPQPIQQLIDDCAWHATKALVGFLEDTAFFTRRGKGGIQVEHAGMAAAVYSHYASRAGDVQLHKHLLVMGVGVDAYGTAAALSRELFRAKMAGGSIFRAELGFQLRMRLGLRLEAKRNWFTVAGVPKQVCEFFSKRRHEIEAALRSHGVSSARASAMATLATRPPKRLEDQEKQITAWREASESLGFGWDQAKKLLHRAPLAPTSAAERMSAANRTVNEMVTTISHFSERGLVRRLADEVCVSGWSAAHVRGTVRDTLKSPQVIKIAVENDQPQFTTRAVLCEEKNILQAAERLSKENRHAVRPEIVERVLERQEQRACKSHKLPSLLALAGIASHSLDKKIEHPLNDEQRPALRAMTGSGDICVISGPPGAAKTTLIREGVKCWKAENFRIVCLAPTGKAAQGLEEGTGIRSFTIHRALADLTATKFDDLKHHARQFTRAARGKRTWALDRVKLDGKCIVVVDEAGMCNSTQIATILKHVEKAKCKCVFVGGSDQLQAVERGGAFAAIAKRIGEIKLTTIVRQKEEWAREAVLAVGRSEAEKALHAYSERGLVHVAKDRETAIDALVAEWRKNAAGQLRSYLAIAPTNADVDQLNAKIQRGFGDLHGLGALHLKINGERFHRGDRILFEQNSNWLGVRNGTLGTVVGVDVLHRRLDVRLDSNETVSVQLKHYSHVRLGYALSVHKAQGLTAENILALVGAHDSRQDRELSLVMVSRARGTTKLFCDAFEAGTNLEGLAQQMNQSHKKLFAHDVGRPVEPNSYQSPRHLP